MTKKTKTQIRNFLKLEIPKASEADLNRVESWDFEHAYVVHLAKTYNVADPEALATTIDGMKEPTQRVVAPTVTAPTDGGTEVTEVPERKPLTRKDLTELLMAGIILLVALLGVLGMVHSCDSRKSMDGLKKDMASVKTDVAFIQTTVAAIPKDMPSKADIDTIKGAVTTKDVLGRVVTMMDVVLDMHTNMVKSTDLNVLAHKDDLSKLATKDDLSKLATKDDLSGLARTWHLLRVERKFDAHIAADEAEEEPTPVAPGTITVIVPPDEEE